MKAIILLCMLVLVSSGCTQTGNVVAPVTDNEITSSENTPETPVLPEFDASSVDTTREEENLFLLINERRDGKYIAPLTRVSSVDTIARAYSERMAKEQFFGNKDPEGRYVEDRLFAADIVHFGAAQIISENKVDITANLPQEAFESIIDNKEDQEIIFDRSEPLNWESVGIGIYCIDEKNGVRCFTTVILARFYVDFEDTIKKEFFYPIYLYPTNMYTNKSFTATIDFTSSQKVHLYLFENESQLQYYRRSSVFPKLLGEKNVMNLSRTLEIKPGYVFSVDASKADIWVDPKIIDFRFQIRLLNP